MKAVRGIWIAAVAVALLVAAPVAEAAPSSLFGGSVSCAAMLANGDVRFCDGTTTTWDGQTKIDVDVLLPPEGTGDGPYPLIGVFHGWGGEKIGLNAQTEGWAKEGYAVFSMSDRGWGQSCGASDPAELGPSCLRGYNHLMDDRYEVRDAQYLISVLADEGVAQPQRIGATGQSYGGGISMALAALRDRTMLPDGSLVPWTSPAGTAMSIAAAVPQWPWSDLAYALMPNGRTLDYVTDSPYRGPLRDAPVGISKTSFVGGLFAVGLAASNFSVTDPEADIPAWYARINAGEPYDGDPTAESILEQITTFHSSYYVDHAEEPAPLLIQSGWNDDLFPPDEALRFYQRTRAQYPADPVSLFFMDDGHARSQNKEADVAVFEARLEAWFAYYLKGGGASPSSSVETLTTTCGSPSGGPYTASDWRAISPGEIRLDSAAAQTVVPGSGDPAAGKAFDPIAGGGACAATSAADRPGVANYRLGPAPAGGFTLMGSPTIVADLNSPGAQSELAARLVDVSPAGTETLIARGLYRPTPGTGRVVFQLHPQGYHFAAGDVAKLELLPSDAPYARPSNAQQPIVVSNLELRLPVVEQPGSLGGLVTSPAPKVVPPGYQLAAEYQDAPGAGASRGAAVTGGSGSTAPPVRIGFAGLAGRISADRGRLRVPLRCLGQGACAGQITISAARRGSHRRTVLGRGKYTIAAAARSKLQIPLTRTGRRLLAATLAGRGGRSGRIKARLRLSDAGRPTTLDLDRRIRIQGRGHRPR